MNLALHPWFREARMAMRRDPHAARGWLGLGVLMLAASIAISLTRHGAFAAVVAFLASWPVPVALAVAGASYALTRSRLAGLIDEWREGWWTAVPLDRYCVARSVIVLAAVVTGLIGALLAVLLVTAHGSMPDRDTWPALIAIEAGLVVGAAAGTAMALRGARARVETSQTYREPLLRLAWLHDRRLPHLSDWQRRDALQGWRRGGNFWLPGAALLAMPNGVPLGTVVGMFLLAVTLAWTLVVLRACGATMRAAGHLLAANPLSRRVFTAAALRYPLFALGCALLLIFAGIVVAGVGWRSLLISVVLIGVAAAHGHRLFARRREGTA